MVGSLGVLSASRRFKAVSELRFSSGVQGKPFHGTASSTADTPLVMGVK